MARFYRILSIDHNLQRGRGLISVVCSENGLEDPMVGPANVMVLEEPLGGFAEFDGWQYAYIDDKMFLVESVYQSGLTYDEDCIIIVMKRAQEYQI